MVAIEDVLGGYYARAGAGHRTSGGARQSQRRNLPHGEPVKAEAALNIGAILYYEI
jgi:hypothetical protein